MVKNYNFEIFAREKSKLGKEPFFAKYDENAIWLDDLKPAFGEKFFFEDELNAFKASKTC